MQVQHDGAVLHVAMSVDAKHVFSADAAGLVQRQPLGFLDLFAFLFESVHSNPSL